MLGPSDSDLESRSALAATKASAATLTVTPEVAEEQSHARTCAFGFLNRWQRSQGVPDTHQPPLVVLCCLISMQSSFVHCPKVGHASQSCVTVTAKPSQRRSPALPRARKVHVQAMQSGWNPQQQPQQPMQPMQPVQQMQPQQQQMGQQPRQPMPLARSPAPYQPAGPVFLDLTQVGDTTGAAAVATLQSTLQQTGFNIYVATRHSRRTLPLCMHAYQAFHTDTWPRETFAHGAQWATCLPCWVCCITGVEQAGDHPHQWPLPGHHQWGLAGPCCRHTGVIRLGRAQAGGLRSTGGPEHTTTCRKHPTVSTETGEYPSLCSCGEARDTKAVCVMHGILTKHVLRCSQATVSQVELSSLQRQLLEDG